MHSETAFPSEADTIDGHRDLGWVRFCCLSEATCMYIVKDLFNDSEVRIHEVDLSRANDIAA